MDFDLSDVVYGMFKIISGSDFGGGLDDLKKTIASYNTDAYQFSQMVNSSFIKPIAAVILAIILVLELSRISSKVDGDQKLGTQQVAAAILKAVLMIIAIQNVDLIVGAINQVGDTAIKGIGSATTTNPAVAIPSETDIKDAGLGAQLGLMMILLLPWLIGVVAGLAVKVVVFVRFAEIYVLSAAATLPLVFMAHPETKSISVGYLRKYASAVLQGIMLIIVVKVFDYLKVGDASGLHISKDSMVGDTLSQMGTIILPAVVFLFLVISSGRLARALVGE